MSSDVEAQSSKSSAVEHMFYVLVGRYGGPTDGGTWIAAVCLGHAEALARYETFVEQAQALHAWAVSKTKEVGSHGVVSDSAIRAEVRRRQASGEMLDSDFEYLDMYESEYDLIAKSDDPTVPAQDITPERGRSISTPYVPIPFVAGSSLRGIENAVLAVPGVTGAAVIERESPPCTIEVIVSGGEDVDIAVAIFGSVPAGISTVGNRELMARDSQGADHSIRFSRPVPF